jgi:hypothetical protein
MSPDTKQYVIDSPIIFERRPKKKKPSPITRDVQVVERHLSQALHRTVRAADSGLSIYRKAQKKSAVRQRDGALVDIGPNMLKGSVRTMRELSLVPYDLWRAAYTPQARRMTRGTVRFMIRVADEMLDI